MSEKTRRTGTFRAEKMLLVNQADVKATADDIAMSLQVIAANLRFALACTDDERRYVVKWGPVLYGQENNMLCLAREVTVALLRVEDAEVGELTAGANLPEIYHLDDTMRLPMPGQDSVRLFRRVPGGLWERTE